LRQCSSNGTFGTACAGLAGAQALPRPRACCFWPIWPVFCRFLSWLCGGSWRT